jgi:hypothetical protein
MRLHSACLTVGSGAGLAMLCFAASLELTATASIPVNGPSGGSAGWEAVNRALKGDRLRVIIRPPDAAPLRGGPIPELLDGCESAIGRVNTSRKAKLAQSCVT